MRSKAIEGLVRCEDCGYFSQKFQASEPPGSLCPMDDLCELADDPYMDRDGPNEVWYNCPLKTRAGKRG